MFYIKKKKKKKKTRTVNGQNLVKYSLHQQETPLGIFTEEKPNNDRC